jgi:hypothetical protein
MSYHWCTDGVRIVYRWGTHHVPMVCGYCTDIVRMVYGQGHSSATLVEGAWRLLGGGLARRGPYGGFEFGFWRGGIPSCVHGAKEYALRAWHGLGADGVVRSREDRMKGQSYVALRAIECPARCNAGFHTCGMAGFQGHRIARATVTPRLARAGEFGDVRRGGRGSAGCRRRGFVQARHGRAGAVGAGVWLRRKA